jgi:hypothetical protein
MRYIELKPGDVFTVPRGSVVEMHGRGAFGLIRSLGDDLRPPRRKSESAAGSWAIEAMKWRIA